jgi:hypothetical protein
MKNSVFILFYLVFFTSCASIGGKTLFQSPTISTMKWDKIGYFNLEDDQKIEKHIPYCKFAYEDGVEKTMKKNGCNQIMNLNTAVPNGAKYASLIKEICKKEQLNGVLSVELVPLKIIIGNPNTIDLNNPQYQAAEVKLFDENGDLVMHSRFNTTYGKTYMSQPHPEDFIRDAVAGAIKIIAQDRK